MLMLVKLESTTFYLCVKHYQTSYLRYICNEHSFVYIMHDFVLFRW